MTLTPIASAANETLVGTLTSLTTTDTGANYVGGSAIDTTGADVIVACAESFDGVIGATPFTDNKGNTYTPIGVYTTAPAHMWMYICESPIVGPGHTFTFTVSVANYMTMVVEALSGSAAVSLDQGSNATITNAVTTNVNTASITTTQVSEMLYVFGGNDNGGTSTITNLGNTAVWTKAREMTNGAGGGAALIRAPVNALGSYSVNYSAPASGHTTAGIFSLKAAIAPGQTAAVASIVSNAGSYVTDTGSSVGSAMVTALNDASDANYIVSPLQPVNAAVLMHMTALSPPTAGTRTIVLRMLKDQSGQTVNYTVNLKRGSGGTTIQSFTGAMPETATEVDLTVTNAITDAEYGNLDIEVSENQP